MPFDFKKIKGLFVVEDEQGVKPASAPAETSSPAAAPSPAASYSESGKVTDKFMEVLASAMQQSNLPGLDYLEYKQSLNSLAKMPMDEQVRYQSAFAMAQAMGATPQKLAESAGHYLDVLRGEEAKFQQALRNQQNEQIGGRLQQAKSLDEAIRQKEEQIKKLEEEIGQHRAQAEQIRQEVAAAGAKVEATKNNFQATYAALTAQIAADLENMKKYLK